MLQRRANLWVAVPFLAFFLTACGFHLRGQAPIPAALQQLTLNLETGSPAFERDLRNALSRADISVVDALNATADTYELRVNSLSTSDTILARDSSNDVTQVERRLSATYFIRNKDGKALYGPRNVSTSIILGNQNAEESTKSAYNAQQMENAGGQLADELVYDLSYAPL
ncbi:LPS assembly lipoprotein LptE [Rhodanobacter aciditrophus]|uniref:LPS-assembly lipoprotein LptE n=1 Tax=Rhodanobacter aciditrophus TaxID=1623218 RepID=A0ABW4B3J8_9GAMM